MKLFYWPGTCALASHIALEEVGADYEAVRVDFSANDHQKPDYLEINPKGRVPALVTDKGVLTETPALLFYFAQTFPDANLAPLDDPHALAEIQSFNSYLCATVHVAHAHKLRGHRWAREESSIEDMRSKVAENMLELCQLIEEQLGDQEWLFGGQFSISDIYLFTVARWLEGDGVDLNDIPRIADHMERVWARPAVQRAMAEEGLL